VAFSVPADLAANLQSMTRKRRVTDPATPDVSQAYPNVNDDQSEVQNYQSMPASYPSVTALPAMTPPGTAATDTTSGVPMPALPGANPYSQFPAGPAPQDPNVPVQPNRSDAIYNDKFSRKRGFVEGLMRGLATGNPLAGVIEGGIGAASKRIGGDMAYQHDFGNYANTRMTQLKLEDADPNLRHQLQMDTLKQQMNNLITRTGAIGDIQTKNKEALQDNAAGNKATFATEISGPQRLAEIKARVEGQKGVKELAGQIKASGKLDEATALFKAMGFDDVTAKAHATQYLNGVNEAGYEKLLAQADQAGATADLRDKQAANVGQGKPANGLTANKSLDVDLKETNDTLKALNAEEAALGKQRNTMSPTQYQTKLKDIADRKVAAHAKYSEIVNQHRQPAAGVTRPSGKSPYPKGQVVTKGDGTKMVSTGELGPNGKPTFIPQQ